MGSDPYLLQDNPADHYFNPRSPHGERPVHRGELTQANKFQSTLPAWGATVQEANNNTMLDISIHAPRMGSDMQVKVAEANIFNFNPRSPHGERLSHNVLHKRNY